MRKKTLVTLYILGWIAAFGAIASQILSLKVITSQCPNNTCTSLPGPAILGLILGAVLTLVATVLIIVTWIAVLIKQAQRQQWAWFVCTLLFSYITMIIYWIAVPESSTSTQGISYQPPVPGSL